MTNAARLQTGEILAGKFCVERIIATGGVGVVVAARHMQLGETVALKFLIPQADRDVTDVARFVREAQSAAKLKNEHVARVLDVGSLEDGTPFMVMEYLEGSDLDQILRHRGPFSITDAVDYVMQACEAIAEAHHLGIVHRDIKPSNFFLTSRTDGSPLIKVLDFGIAKARAELQQDLSLTKTRTVLGSPVYMSPEQIRSAKSVDHRTDIWSLGVTLYELLTDQLPFDGDSITGVAAAVSTDPIAPIRALRPEIPEGLSAVIERCLEKRPGDRYQTIAEFAAALVPYGPESARYSLTRIRGVLNLRLEPGSEVVTLVADGGALAEELVPIGNATSSTLSSVATAASHRGRFLVALAVLVSIVVAFGLLRRRQQDAPASTRMEQSADRKAENSSFVSAAIPVPQEPASVMAISSAPASTTTSAPPTLPTVLTSARVQASTHPARRTTAQVNARASGPKSRAEKSSDTKDSQGHVRYEAIFDTRK